MARVSEVLLEGALGVAMATGKSSKGRGRRSLVIEDVSAGGPSWWLWLHWSGTVHLASAGRWGASAPAFAAGPVVVVRRSVENRATTSGWKQCGYFPIRLAAFFGGLRSKRQ